MPELPVKTDPFTDELQRILSSETLRSSDSLRRLLDHLGQAYLTGNARNLKEYSIGRDVMGKPEDYDPRVDSSVRVQIGKLRQRLEQYYTTEAPNSENQIQLPKGHFELKLIPRAIPSPAAAPQTQPGSFWKWAAAALALGLAVSLIWRPVPVTAVQPMPSEMEIFWAPFLSPDKPLTVVLGSPLFIRFHSSYFRDPWINEWEEAQKRLPLQEMSRLLKSPTTPQETYRWTPFGESSAAFRLALLLGPRKKDILLKRSRVLAWEDVRSTNVIFLGPAKFNPQLKDLPVRQELVIESGAVRNLNPQPGERDLYQKPSAPNEEEIPEEYAVITRISAREGWGEVLVLASTSTEGTWAAADFVTQAPQLRMMEEKLRAGRSSMPDAWQVLIRGRFKNQVPIQTEYVTHHVLR